MISHSTAHAGMSHDPFPMFAALSWQLQQQQARDREELKRTHERERQVTADKREEGKRAEEQERQVSADRRMRVEDREREEVRRDAEKKQRAEDREREEVRRGEERSRQHMVDHRSMLDEQAQQVQQQLAQLFALTRGIYGQPPPQLFPYGNQPRR